jgi:methyl-accepting chemotaxis protein
MLGRGADYRLVAGIATVILLMVIGAAVAVIGMAWAGAGLDRLYYQGTRAAHEFAAIQLELLASDTALKRYVAAGDPVQRRWLEAELELRDWHIAQSLARVRAAPLPPETRAHLQSFEARYERYRDLYNSLLAAGSGGPVQEAEALLDGPVATAYTAANELITELISATIHEGERHYRWVRAETQLMLVASAAGLVLALAVSSVLVRAVARRIALAATEQAAAIGQARQSAAEAAMARDLASKRLADLEQAYRSLAGAAEGIAELASGLTQMARQQAGQAAQQAAAVSQVASTMDELWSTAEEIARSAQDSLAAAEEGAASVEEAIAAIEANRRTVDHVAQQAVALGRESQAIGNIVDLITDLANKIHLLALNAALEAENAGEHGRRFGAVAQQVKELARSARQATTEVKAMISRLQAAANAAVMATEQAAKETHLSASLANQAGGAIQHMVTRMQAISAATQQQQAASEQIASTMRGVEEVVREATLQSQDIAGMAAELSAVAETMRQQCTHTSEMPRVTPEVDGAGEQTPLAQPRAPASALPSRS